MEATNLMAVIAAQKESEEQAIRAARQGDLAAFNALVLAHQALAYNMARRIVGDADAAADVTQDSFLKAYRGLQQFQGGLFRPWLLRIVINTCYDLLRFRKRHPSSSLDDAEASDEYDDRWRARGESPEEGVIRQELNGTIQAALATLPAEQRVAVVLCDIEGLTYEEIAQSTGSQVGTVKSRVSRGRARLRDLLQAQGAQTTTRPPRGDLHRRPLAAQPQPGAARGGASSVIDVR
jgi:RNA polymerase sigma factor (sigma-70 family)